MFNTACLYSTVKNTSGGRAVFSFLPPHGREMAANEEFTILGNVQESVIRLDRVTSKRQLTALENAIARGDLQILNTPAPILEASSGLVKMLQLSPGGQVSAVDPCWTSSL